MEILHLLWTLNVVYWVLLALVYRAFSAFLKGMCTELGKNTGSYLSGKKHKNTPLILITFSAIAVAFLVFYVLFPVLTLFLLQGVG